MIDEVSRAKADANPSTRPVRTVGCGTGNLAGTLIFDVCVDIGKCSSLFCFVFIFFFSEMIVINYNFC